MKFIKQSLSLFLSCCLVLATAPAGFAAQANQSAAQPAPVQAAEQTPEQLQQLVAPIALYPDALGSTDSCGRHVSRPSCRS